MLCRPFELVRIGQNTGVGKSTLQPPFFILLSLWLMRARCLLFLFASVCLLHQSHTPGFDHSISHSEADAHVNHAPSEQLGAGRRKRRKCHRGGLSLGGPNSLRPPPLLNSPFCLLFRRSSLPLSPLTLMVGKCFFHPIWRLCAPYLKPPQLPFPARP